MTSRILKILAILAVTSLVAGCKFSVIVGEGGKVQSSSGTRNCSEGSTCTFQVSDTTFSDTFTAVPLSGYKFARWQGGTDYQCANSTSPTCVVSNTALAGNAAAATIIASDRVFTIKPVFHVITAPLATLVGRDPADTNKTITIGPVVHVALADRMSELGIDIVSTIVEYEGKNYRADVDIEYGGLTDFHYSHLHVFSDPNCQDLIGTLNGGARAIVGNGFDATPTFYSVDPENRVSLATIVAYRLNQGGYPCYRVSDNRIWVFPYTVLPISQEDLFKGSVPPYSVIYN